MVSKSYAVNECSNVIDDDDKSLTRMTKIDRYILQISNEMVSEKNAKRRRTRKARKRQGHRRRNKKQFGTTFGLAPLTYAHLFFSLSIVAYYGFFTSPEQMHNAQ